MLRIEVNVYEDGTAFCPALVMRARSREEIEAVIGRWCRFPVGVVWVKR